MDHEPLNTPSGTVSYGVLDGCYATVQDCCRKGVFLHLDNGEAAFAYGPANLQHGVKVLCTVQKPSQGGRRARVTVDAVLWDEYDAA